MILPLLLASLLSAPVCNPSQLSFTASGGVKRAVCDKLSDVVSVKDGAAVKGDGSTNDSTAFAAAIALAASQGRAVYVPGGTYLLKNVAVSAAITIECEGRTVTTFKLPALASLDGSPIFNVTVGGVTFRHCGFDGNKANQPADGFSDSWNGGAAGQGRSYRALIRATAVSEIQGLIVEDCLLQNAYGAAIATQNFSHVKVRRNLANNNNFELADLTSTTATSAGPYYSQQDVSFNEVRNTGSGDASVNGNAIVFNHATESLVSYNLTDTSERNGFKCEGCQRTTAIGNIINNVTVSGFPGISYQIDCTDCSAIGNTITNASQGVTFGHVAGGTGFFDIQASNNTINAITGSNPNGIVITLGATSSGFSLTGNILRGMTGFGIYIPAGAAYTDAVIANNNIQTIGGTNGAAGIKVAATTAGTAGLSVTGNVVDLNSSTSSDAAINFVQSGGQTIARASIVGNIVLNQSGRTTITDGNVALFTSGVFGGNVTDGFIRMGSTALQSLGPSTGGFSAGFQFAGMQGTAVTFANIGTPSNGTILYCSDCTIANPCAGAGTGALAKRLNGVWVCN